LGGLENAKFTLLRHDLLTGTVIPDISGYKRGVIPDISGYKKGSNSVIYAEAR
jgi:hypothetical protein